MTINRKHFLHGAAATLGASAFGQAPAFGQGAYPSQTFTIVVGFAPGSGADIFARYFADKLRALTGRTVLVENKPGANASIATTYVARSKPDGYTLYPFAGTTVAATMHLFKEPPVDVGKTITVAATTSNLAFMCVVDVDSPHKTIADLTAAMKKKGASATFATAANPGVIMGALYKQATGIEAVEVPYRMAADSINELQTGKLDYALHDPIFALAQVRAGRMRALAVSSSERMGTVPDVPTMKEAGVPMDLDIWWGVMVQKATPKPILHKINSMFREILTTDETKAFLALSGADPMLRTPEQADAMFQKAIVEWGDYVKLAKIPQT